MAGWVHLGLLLSLLRSLGPRTRKPKQGSESQHLRGVPGGGSVGGRRQRGLGASSPRPGSKAAGWDNLSIRLEEGSSRLPRGILVTSWLPAPRTPRLECGLGLRSHNSPVPKPDVPPSIPHGHPKCGRWGGRQEPELCQAFSGPTIGPEPSEGAVSPSGSSPMGSSERPRVTPWALCCSQSHICPPGHSPYSTSHAYTPTGELIRPDTGAFAPPGHTVTRSAPRAALQSSEQAKH